MDVKLPSQKYALIKCLTSFLITQNFLEKNAKMFMLMLKKIIGII